jgi:DNA-binding LacI/PurR family transcriptional regulator
MNDIKSKRPRQADIAASAGVSVATVSRVLANEPGISSSVREHILRVAAEHGYETKGASTALPGTLALIASDGVTGGLSVFYEAIVEGLRAGRLKQTLPFEVRLIREDRATPEVIGDYMRRPEAEGLFLVGIDPNSLCGAGSRRSEFRSSWSTEPTRSFALMVSRRRISLAPARLSTDCSPPGIVGSCISAARIATPFANASVASMRPSHAVDGAESRMVPMSFNGSASREAHELMTAVLAEKAGFTAAFCMNDFIAVGVLEAVTEAGLRVPDDFAIVGFDDLPCAVMTDPPLSTMRVDRAALGRESIGLMIARFRDRTAPARHVCHAVIPVAGGTVPMPETDE